MKEIRKFGEEDVETMILGNKSDLLNEEDTEQDEVDLKQAKEYAKQNDSIFYTVSAKTSD